MSSEQENREAEFLQKFDKRVDEKIQASKGDNPNQDISTLLESTKNVTVQEMLGHKPCGDENCPMCSMKADIDKQAYERGLDDGTKLQERMTKLGS